MCSSDLAETLRVLLAEGLVLERFDEGDRVPWQPHDGMVQDGEYWRFADGEPRVPLSMTVVVRAPR